MVDGIPISATCPDEPEVITEIGKPLAGDATRERLADYAHRAWSGWMEYLFDRSFENEYGQVMIPAAMVQRWKRQMGTPYERLSPEEKESDRREADTILEILR